MKINKKAVSHFLGLAVLFGAAELTHQLTKTEEQVTYSVTLEDLASANVETNGENTNGRINQNCPPDRRYCELSRSCIPWEELCSLDSSTGDNGGDTVICYIGSRHAPGYSYYDCNTCTRIQNCRGYGDSRRCTLPFPSQ